MFAIIEEIHFLKSQFLSCNPELKNEIRNL